MFEKTLAIILLLTIGATIAKPAADSSQPCTTTGELKQVSDCGGEYYICDNGAWKIMPCPGGLKFSEAHNRCEWDYNVAGCSSTEDAETTTTTATTTTTTTTEADSSSSCTTIGELKQDSDCGGDYYICDHGGWTKMSCPAGLKFSEAANQCDWDYNVAGCNTDAAETTTTTAATTTTTEDSSASCTTSGELKQVSDCGGDYYICDHGKWTQMSCPAGLKFSEAANQCDWDYNVAGCNTDAADTTTTTAATTTTTEESSASCTTSGELKQVSDCGGDYYICDHGEWRQMSCPAGLKFSEAANQCDWDYNVAGCNTDAAETTTTTAATTTTTTEADSSASCATSGEMKQVSDCGGDYYICDHGEWTQMSCPAGLKFSEAANQCDWDYNVAGCNTDAAETTTTTAATTTTTTEADSSASCTTSGELKQVSDCGGDYYICDHGKWTQMSCPEGLKFSEAANQCEWDYNVAGCNTDPAETTTTTAVATTTTTTTTTEDPDACTHEALIPTDECSGQFIQCVHGEEVIIECPADLIFDVETGRCEYEQDVASCAAITQVKEETVCEHDWLRIKCEDSKKIKVISASFGRSSKDVCRYGLLKDTNCHSSKSDSVVSKKCEGKSRCNVWASIWLFGDPCFLTYKYLQVEYQCV